MGRTFASLGYTLAIAWLCALPLHGLTEALAIEPGHDLAGVWTLVAVENIKADGTRLQPYGPAPDGLLVFAGDGRYSVHIYRHGRPRFAGDDKNQGSAEENQTTVRGTNSHFGRYLVDQAEQTLTFRIEHASFPNWEGSEQRRTFTVVGDLLRYTVRTPTSGGAGEVAEVTWRRASN
jgi:hypothetical protein